jgi:WD40 repeat protein
VINGPACSEGYVWWLVQAGTITGWTVESSFDDDDYFLEATPGNEVTSLPVASGQVVSLQLREDAQNTPSSAVFTSDGLFVLADSALQSGTSVVAEYDANTGTPTDLGMAVAGQLLRTNQVLSNGTVVIADETSLYFFNKQNNTYQQGTVLSNVLIVNQTTGTFAVSPDGTVVVISTCTDANCTTVNTYLRAINQLDAIWTAQLPAQFRPQKIFFSPDGQTVAMFGGQAVYFFDRATGIQLGLVSNATPQALMLDAVYNPANPALFLTSICKQTTNGVCVLGEVTLWDTSSYQAVGIVETNQAEPVAIAYSPNGQLIFVGDTNGEIVVRNGENGESVTSFTIGNGQQATEISSLAVSADNTKLVASTVAGVFIWNIADLSDSGARG